MRHPQLYNREFLVSSSEVNNLDYELYEDEGISGFKISDDDLDPKKERFASYAARIGMTFKEISINRGRKRYF